MISISGEQEDKQKEKEIEGGCSITWTKGARGHGRGHTALNM